MTIHLSPTTVKLAPISADRIYDVQRKDYLNSVDRCTVRTRLGQAYLFDFATNVKLLIEDQKVLNVGTFAFAYIMEELMIAWKEACNTTLANRDPNACPDQCDCGANRESDVVTP